MLNLLRNVRPAVGVRLAAPLASIALVSFIPFGGAAAATPAQLPAAAGSQHATTVVPLTPTECARIRGSVTAQKCEVRIETSIQAVAPAANAAPASSQTFYEYANACFDDGAVLDQPDNGANCGEGEITVEANVTINWATHRMSTPWEQCKQKATAILGAGWGLSDPTWCAYTGNGTANFTIGGNWDASNPFGSGTAQLRIFNTYVSEGGVSLVHETATAYWNGV